MFDDRGCLNEPFTGAPAACRELAEFYRRQLTEDILLWWTRNAVDREHGGLFSCIRDDGTITSHDKYIWSQTRALWTFAATCNRVAELDEWRDVADGLYRFLIGHAQRPEGDWNYLLSREGELKQGPESIQTDAYAICALVEYARLTDGDEVIDAALRTYRAALEKLRNPGSYGTKPYPIPEGTKAQRVCMQFSLSFADLGKYLGDAEILAEGMRLTDEVLDHFRRPEREAMVEYLSADNETLPAPQGTYMSPGHGIESAWFQLENLRGQEAGDRIGKALDVMRWSFEKGWDPEHGGLFLHMDIDGGPPYLPNGDTKIWWPHCEAICGALLAREMSGEPWCLDWYSKTHDWAFAQFPDREHGEWTQRLDRTGNRIDTVVALPVKDPFHLPRALIFAAESLERMAAKWE